MLVKAKQCGSAIGSILVGKGEVESVFLKVVNIRLNNGFCLSLADDYLDYAPNRIILSKDVLEALAFQPREKVEVQTEVVKYKQHTIQLTPPYQEKLIGSVPTSASVQVIRQALQNGKGASLNYLGLTMGGIIEQHLSELIKAFSTDLSAGFDLIGLGHGYTPSGDDFLVGYSATAHHLKCLDLDWHDRLVAKAFLDTTSLSATALYFAGQGEVQGYLGNVISNLADPTRLENSCLSLINEVGTTSGSDLLLGVLICCSKYLLQSRRDYHHVQKGNY